ncbi:hypothetical protein [Enterococcus sp.]
MWITKQQRKDSIGGLTFLYRVATRDPVDAQRRIEELFLEMQSNQVERI